MIEDTTADEVARLKARVRDLEDSYEHLLTAVHFSLLDMARGDNERARERLVDEYGDPAEMLAPAPE